MTNVIKVGGNQLDEPEFLERLARWISSGAPHGTDGPPVVVHGGGRAIAQLQEQLGMQPVEVAGLRVTDARSLAVVQMVLTGDANKRIVRAVLMAGADAVGLSGVDRGLLRCRKMEHPEADLGFVGRIETVRADVLEDLLVRGIVPVISPVSLGMDGQIYNVNADDAAAEVAAALHARRLDLISDVPGILAGATGRDGEEVLSRIGSREVEGLIDDGTIHGGMVPKVRAAVRAVEGGVGEVRILDLPTAVDGGDGTRIVGDARRGGKRVEEPGGGSGDGSGVDGEPGSDVADGGATDRDAQRRWPVPEVDSARVIRDDARAVLQTYGRPPMVLVRGEGAWLFDAEGRRYLDFTAGIAVTALGHGDARWVRAVREQAARLTHVSNLYYTEPQATLAAKLVEGSFADRVFFCNSGGEAVEGAIKFARKTARAESSGDAAQIPGGPADDGAGATPHGRHGRTGIVAFERSFHGRSAGALSLTHKRAYREPFAPLVPGVRFAPFDDLAAARELIDETVCAVFVEPIQGEGGYHPASLQFLAGLRRLCDERGALLVFDEIQCGLGRTGGLWAHEMYAVTPDIMTVAKPLAGGLPIGVVMMTERVARNIGRGDHGSTFGGGPLVCAAANEVLDRVSDPDFLADVRAKGAALVDGLLEIGSPRIVDVRGAGLMIGVEFDMPVKPLVEAMRERGILTLAAGERTLRLCPPLVITERQIRRFVDGLAACLQLAQQDGPPGG